jgi:hypothetical protein
MNKIKRSGGKTVIKDQGGRAKGKGAKARARQAKDKGRRGAKGRAARVQVRTLGLGADWGS